MATDPAVRRYSRGARWLHAGVYLTVLILLATGWWLALGREGRPSPLARLTGLADITLHTWIGWALAVIVAAGVLVGARGVGTFVRETLRHDRGDLRWFVRWPAALVTGRFAHHDGHFDPGQRIANLIVVGLLAVLIGSGVALVTISGGPAFVWLVRVHRWSTYAITPVLIGHIVIASGILPGYRGVARAMHLGGRLPVAVARRVWPGWLARQHSVPADRRPCRQDGGTH
jgi:formate dehydrogenase subunit gamma